MKNEIIREISINNLVELSNVIEKCIFCCKDVQIYVSAHMFKRLLEENRSSIIWQENVCEGCSCNSNNEKAFIFHIQNNNESKVAQMHFDTENDEISGYLDYIHLTYYASNGNVYRHYSNGFKIRLIINSE